MRTLTILLILAASTLAHAGTWQILRQNDDDEPGSEAVDTSCGNAREMDVVAVPMATHAAALVKTDAGSPDEFGAGADEDTVWYELSYCGDGTATNHAWSIETDIHGQGTATAKATVMGRAVIESLNLIRVTGDHRSSGRGRLGAASTSDVEFSLLAPSGFGDETVDTILALGNDAFATQTWKKTTGSGKKCRVRIDSAVLASGSARAVIGTAEAILKATLRVDLEMTGTCTIGAFRITDRFRIGPGGVTTPPIPGAAPPPGESDEPPVEDEDDEPEDEVPPPPTTEGADSPAVE
ncbi:MAG: hypothetical protein ABFS86_06290 [Planctomycetota bacterium]